MVRTQGVHAVPDGGWGWLVVVAAFTNHILFDGIQYSCGVFYADFLEYFHSSRSDTSWVGSINGGCMMLSGPIAGTMIRKLGCRFTCMVGTGCACVGLVTSMFSPNIYVLYVTFGALTGFGFALMFLSSIVCVGWYFEKRRSFATGLAVCGAGVGTFIMAPLTQFLIERYAWKGAILILGGLMANGFVCSVAFAPLPIKKGWTTEIENPVILDDNDNDESFKPQTEMEKYSLKPKAESIIIASHASNLSIAVLKDSPTSLSSDIDKSSRIGAKDVKVRYTRILKDPVFLIYLLQSIASMGYSAPFQFIPDYAQNIGIDLRDASFLISVIGIVSTACRVLLGVVSDFEYVAPYRLYIYVITFVVGGVSCAMIAYCTSYAGLVVCAALYGYAIARYTILTQLVLDLFTMDSLVEVYVITNCLNGIIGILGMPFLGWIFDKTGSYTISFVISGLLTAIGGCSLLFIPLVRRCQKSEQDDVSKQSSEMLE